jgi:hypothetical protein
MFKAGDRVICDQVSFGFTPGTSYQVFYVKWSHTSSVPYLDLEDDYGTMRSVISSDFIMANTAPTPAMSAFLIGDRVICSSTNGMSTFLTSGNIYTVLGVSVDASGVSNIEVKTDIGSIWPFPVGLFKPSTIHSSSTLSEADYKLLNDTAPRVKADKHEGHEIVDNEVMGKKFKYCRVCKDEV